VGTDPQRHAIARIPDEVAFSLDIRSQSAQTLAEMQIYLAEEMADIARARGVRFETGPRVDTAPAMMDRGIVDGLLAAMAAGGLDPFSMASGGGHDAAVFAQAGIPAGMIFVRNRNGSHNPDEAMELDDFLVATSILARFLEE
jgi:N-carbamoyl-L-amino-acid hydrolase